MLIVRTQKFVSPFLNFCALIPFDLKKEELSGRRRVYFYIVILYMQFNLFAPHPVFFFLRLTMMRAVGTASLLSFAAGQQAGTNDENYCFEHCNR